MLHQDHNPTYSIFIISIFNRWHFYLTRHNPLLAKFSFFALTLSVFVNISPITLQCHIPHSKHTFIYLFVWFLSVLFNFTLLGCNPYFELKIIFYFYFIITQLLQRALLLLSHSISPHDIAENLMPTGKISSQVLSPKTKGLPIYRQTSSTTLYHVVQYPISHGFRASSFVTYH